MQTLADLADWAEQAGIPALAGTQATLDAARELRETLFRSFLAALDEHPPDLRSVSICQADNYGRLFLDRRHLRRWCTKEGCGNRAKAARHYQRVKARRAPPSHAIEV
ncbi:CGNR zinc finger domain-containing protein [Nonomuraea angiospora]